MSNVHYLHIFLAHFLLASCIIPRDMTKATVLITRPEPEAAQLANRLHALGYSVISEPMLDIAYSEDTHKALERAFEGLLQGVIITSKNALMALAERPFTRDMPLWVVGSATEQAARDLRFTNLRSPGKDADGAEALVEYILAQGAPGRGKFVYLSSTSTYADVAGMLREQGFSVEHLPVYEATPRTALSERLKTALHDGKVDVATFFSPLSARSFATAVTEAGLAPTCNAVTALCLSKNVAAALGNLTFQRTACADAPHADRVVVLLESLYAGGSAGAVSINA